MSSMVKLISAAAMIAGFSAVTILPAHALSVIGPAYEGQADVKGQTYSNPPVAFVGSAAENANSTGLSLSPQEIQHVKWCAEKYPSYHATDNSYQTKQGLRTECRSPY